MLVKVITVALSTLLKYYVMTALGQGYILSIDTDGCHFPSNKLSIGLTQSNIEKNSYIPRIPD